jgi:hypothetical protein
MNTGRFTSFFGAPNVADTYDGLSMVEAMMEQDKMLILKHVEIKILDYNN